ncbi:hypothetical protein KKF34_10125 [Myxococcota bacterium]|nr:hypothetical protein [Myxococcota bacterium]MBU1497223.1 hypothetical protein [Myxococcota bacterium]
MNSVKGSTQCGGVWLKNMMKIMTPDGLSYSGRGKLNPRFRSVFADQNRWRVRRLVLKPDNSSFGLWEDRHIYNGRYGDTPVSLLYQAKTNDFLTVCNLARLLKPEQDKEFLHGIKIQLKTDDSNDTGQLVVASAKENTGSMGVYFPVIPLELSPMRFRVLLPLDSSSNCLDLAVKKWKEQFSRVWDRLPLRVGVVAFPRMMPFQAVIEATRGIEEDLDSYREPEIWRVMGCKTQESVTALSFKSANHPYALLKTIPTKLRDGREDVFYPYLAVEEKQVRYSLDFQHPDGQVYRHAKELRTGDGVFIYPTLISTLYMDSTARRFAPLNQRQLTDWLQMRDLWTMIEWNAPSQSAIHGAWSELISRREDWQDLNGNWMDGGKETWLDLTRAVFYDRLGVRGACLEALVEAAGTGLLDWSLEWHMNVLKKQVSGGDI